VDSKRLSQGFRRGGLQAGWRGRGGLLRSLIHRWGSITQVELRSKGQKTRGGEEGLAWAADSRISGGYGKELLPGPLATRRARGRRCAPSRSGGFCRAGGFLSGEQTHPAQMFHLREPLGGGARGAFGVERGCFLPGWQPGCWRWGGVFHGGRYLSHECGLLLELFAREAMGGRQRCVLSRSGASECGGVLLRFEHSHPP
jgi:hypothetical protein